MTTKFIDQEEKNIIESYEKGEWVQTSDLKARRNELNQAFKNTVTNKKAISIRLLENDISKIKSKAIQEGIPYQTLISSVIHKYINGNVHIK